MRANPRRVPPAPRFQWPAEVVLQPPPMPRGRRFAEYLVRRGALSRGAVAGSLAADDGHLAWYGTLAVLMGFFDRAAIDRILRHQARSGLAFEEIAVATGALSSEESRVVLDLIETCGVTLTEISTALAHLAPEEVGRYLSAYRSSFFEG